MVNKKSYSQSEVDELVRQNIIDYKMKTASQAEIIGALQQELSQTEEELATLKKREKQIERALIIANRKAKYIEETTRTKCAVEIDNLLRFSDSWHTFFENLESKYKPEDKADLEKFDRELKQMIDGLSGINLVAQELSDAEKTYSSESKRLSWAKESVDDRFKRLVSEFDMKVGDNATRKPGRPKKNTGNKKIDEIIDELESQDGKLKNKQQRPLISNVVNKKIATVSNVPKTEDSVFDFDEALNPTENLEAILKDLLGSDYQE